MARKRRNTKESERAPPADPCVEPVGCFESTNRTSTLCAPGNRALAFQLRGTRQAESPDGGNRWVSTGPSDVGRSESRSGTTALVTPQGLQSECGSETHAGALARMQQDSETADRRDPQIFPSPSAPRGPEISAVEALPYPPRGHGSGFSRQWHGAQAPLSHSPVRSVIPANTSSSDSVEAGFNSALTVSAACEVDHRSDAAFLQHFATSRAWVAHDDHISSLCFGVREPAPMYRRPPSHEPSSAGVRQPAAALGGESPGIVPSPPAHHLREEFRDACTRTSRMSGGSGPADPACLRRLLVQQKQTSMGADHRGDIAAGSTVLDEVVLGNEGNEDAFLLRGASAAGPMLGSAPQQVVNAAANLQPSGVSLLPPYLCSVREYPGEAEQPRPVSFFQAFSPVKYIFWDLSSCPLLLRYTLPSPSSSGPDSGGDAAAQGAVVSLVSKSLSPIDVVFMVARFFQSSISSVKLFYEEDPHARFWSSHMNSGAAVADATGPAGAPLPALNTAGPDSADVLPFGRGQGGVLERDVEWRSDPGEVSSGRHSMPMQEAAHLCGRLDRSLRTLLSEMGCLVHECQAGRVMDCVVSELQRALVAASRPSNDESPSRPPAFSARASVGYPGLQQVAACSSEAQPPSPAAPTIVIISSIHFDFTEALRTEIERSRVGEPARVRLLVCHNYDWPFRPTGFLSQFIQKMEVPPQIQSAVFTATYRQLVAAIYGVDAKLLQPFSPSETRVFPTEGSGWGVHGASDATGPHGFSTRSNTMPATTLAALHQQQSLRQGGAASLFWSTIGGRPVTSPLSTILPTPEDVSSLGLTRDLSSLTRDLSSDVTPSRYLKRLAEGAGSRSGDVGGSASGPEGGVSVTNHSVVSLSPTVEGSSSASGGRSARDKKGEMGAPQLEEVESVAPAHQCSPAISSPCAPEKLQVPTSAVELSEGEAGARATGGPESVQPSFPGFAGSSRTDENFSKPDTVRGAATIEEESPAVSSFLSPGLPAEGAVEAADSSVAGCRGSTSRQDATPSFPGLRHGQPQDISGFLVAGAGTETVLTSSEQTSLGLSTLSRTQKREFKNAVAQEGRRRDGPPMKSSSTGEQEQVSSEAGETRTAFLRTSNRNPGVRTGGDTAICGPRSGAAGDFDGCYNERRQSASVPASCATDNKTQAGTCSVAEEGFSRASEDASSHLMRGESTGDAVRRLSEASGRQETQYFQLECSGEETGSNRSSVDFGLADSQLLHAEQRRQMSRGETDSATTSTQTARRSFAVPPSSISPSPEEGCQERVVTANSARVPSRLTAQPVLSRHGHSGLAPHETGVARVLRPMQHTERGCPEPRGQKVTPDLGREVLGSQGETREADISPGVVGPRYSLAPNVNEFSQATPASEVITKDTSRDACDEELLSSFRQAGLSKSTRGHLALRGPPLEPQKVLEYQSQGSPSILFETSGGREDGNRFSRGWHSFFSSSFRRPPCPAPANRSIKNGAPRGRSSSLSTSHFLLTGGGEANMVHGLGSTARERAFHAARPADATPGPHAATRSGFASARRAVRTLRPVLASSDRVARGFSEPVSPCCQRPPASLDSLLSSGGLNGARASPTSARDTAEGGFQGASEDGDPGIVSPSLAPDKSSSDVGEAGQTPVRSVLSGFWTALTGGQSEPSGELRRREETKVSGSQDGNSLSSVSGMLKSPDQRRKDSATLLETTVTGSSADGLSRLSGTKGGREGLSAAEVPLAASGVRTTRRGNNLLAVHSAADIVTKGELAESFQGRRDSGASGKPYSDAASPRAGSVTATSKGDSKRRGGPSAVCGPQFPSSEDVHREIARATKGPAELASVRGRPHRSAASGERVQDPSFAAVQQPSGVVFARTRAGSRPLRLLSKSRLRGRNELPGLDSCEAVPVPTYPTGAVLEADQEKTEGGQKLAGTQHAVEQAKELSKTTDDDTNLRGESFRGRGDSGEKMGRVEYPRVQATSATPSRGDVPASRGSSRRRALFPEQAELSESEAEVSGRRRAVEAEGASGVTAPKLALTGRSSSRRNLIPPGDTKGHTDQEERTKRGKGASGVKGGDRRRDIPSISLQGQGNETRETQGDSRSERRRKESGGDGDELADAFAVGGGLRPTRQQERLAGFFGRAKGVSKPGCYVVSTNTNVTLDLARAFLSRFPDHMSTETWGKGHVFRATFRTQAAVDKLFSHSPSGCFLEEMPLDSGSVRLIFTRSLPPPIAFVVSDAPLGHRAGETGQSAFTETDSVTTSSSSAASCGGADAADASVCHSVQPPPSSAFSSSLAAPPRGDIDPGRAGLPPPRVTAEAELEGSREVIGKAILHEPASAVPADQAKGGSWLGGVGADGRGTDAEAPTGKTHGSPVSAGACCDDPGPSPPREPEAAEKEPSRRDNTDSAPSLRLTKGSICALTGEKNLTSSSHGEAVSVTEDSAHGLRQQPRVATVSRRQSGGDPVTSQGAGDVNSQVLEEKPLTSSPRQRSPGGRQWLLDDAQNKHGPEHSSALVGESTRLVGLKGRHLEGLKEAVAAAPARVEELKMELGAFQRKENKGTPPALGNDLPPLDTITSLTSLAAPRVPVPPPPFSGKQPAPVAPPLSALPTPRKRRSNPNGSAIPSPCDAIPPSRPAKELQAVAKSAAPLSMPHAGTRLSGVPSIGHTGLPRDRSGSALSLRARPAASRVMQRMKSIQRRLEVTGALELVRHPVFSFTRAKASPKPAVTEQTQVTPISEHPVRDGGVLSATDGGVGPSAHAQQRLGERETIPDRTEVTDILALERRDLTEDVAVRWRDETSGLTVETQVRLYALGIESLPWTCFLLRRRLRKFVAAVNRSGLLWLALAPVCLPAGAAQLGVPLARFDLRVNSHLADQVKRPWDVYFCGRLLPKKEVAPGDMEGKKPEIEESEQTGGNEPGTPCRVPGGTASTGLGGEQSTNGKSGPGSGMATELQEGDSVTAGEDEALMADALRELRASIWGEHGLLTTDIIFVDLSADVTELLKPLSGHHFSHDKNTKEAPRRTAGRMNVFAPLAHPSRKDFTLPEGELEAALGEARSRHGDLSAGMDGSVSATWLQCGEGRIGSLTSAKSGNANGNIQDVPLSGNGDVNRATQGRLSTSGSVTPVDQERYACTVEAGNTDEASPEPAKGRCRAEEKEKGQGSAARPSTSKHSTTTEPDAATTDSRWKAQMNVWRHAMLELLERLIQRRFGPISGKHDSIILPFFFGERHSGAGEDLLVPRLFVGGSVAGTVEYNATDLVFGIKDFLLAERGGLRVVREIRPLVACSASSSSLGDRAGSQSLLSSLTRLELLSLLSLTESTCDVLVAPVSAPPSSRSLASLERIGVQNADSGPPGPGGTQKLHQGLLVCVCGWSEEDVKKAFEFLGKIASQLAQYSDRGVPRSVPGHLSGFLSTSSKQENSDTGTTATETGDRLIGLEEDFKVGQVPRSLLPAILRSSAVALRRFYEDERFDIKQTCDAILGHFGGELLGLNLSYSTHPLLSPIGFRCPSSRLTQVFESLFVFFQLVESQLDFCTLPITQDLGYVLKAEEQKDLRQLVSEAQRKAEQRPGPRHSADAPRAGGRLVATTGSGDALSSLDGDGRSQTSSDRDKGGARSKLKDLFSSAFSSTRTLSDRTVGEKAEKTASEISSSSDSMAHVSEASLPGSEKSRDARERQLQPLPPAGSLSACRLADPCNATNDLPSYFFQTLRLIFDTEPLVSPCQLAAVEGGLCLFDTPYQAVVGATEVLPVSTFFPLPGDSGVVWSEQDEEELVSRKTAHLVCVPEAGLSDEGGTPTHSVVDGNVGRDLPEDDARVPGTLPAVRRDAGGSQNPDCRWFPKKKGRVHPRTEVSLAMYNPHDAPKDILLLISSTSFSPEDSSRDRLMAAACDLAHTEQDVFLVSGTAFGFGMVPRYSAATLCFGEKSLGFTVDSLENSHSGLPREEAGHAERLDRCSMGVRVCATSKKIGEEQVRPGASRVEESEPLSQLVPGEIQDIDDLDGDETAVREGEAQATPSKLPATADSDSFLSSSFSQEDSDVSKAQTEKPRARSDTITATPGPPSDAARTNSSSSGTFTNAGSGGLAPLSSVGGGGASGNVRGFVLRLGAGCGGGGKGRCPWHDCPHEQRVTRRFEKLLRIIFPEGADKKDVQRNEFVVPFELGGRFIGPNGKNRRYLTARTQAFLTVANERYRSPDGRYWRRLIVGGDFDARVRAVAEIFRVLQWPTSEAHEPKTLRRGSQKIRDHAKDPTKILLDLLSLQPVPRAKMLGRDDVVGVDCRGKGSPVEVFSPSAALEIIPFELAAHRVLREVSSRLIDVTFRVSFSTKNGDSVSTLLDHLAPLRMHLHRHHLALARRATLTAATVMKEGGAAAVAAGETPAGSSSHQHSDGRESDHSGEQDTGVSPSSSSSALSARGRRGEGDQSTSQEKEIASFPVPLSDAAVDCEGVRTYVLTVRGTAEALNRRTGPAFRFLVEDNNLRDVSFSDTVQWFFFLPDVSKDYDIKYGKEREGREDAPGALSITPASSGHSFTPNNCDRCRASNGAATVAGFFQARDEHRSRPTGTSRIRGATPRVAQSRRRRDTKGSRGAGKNEHEQESSLCTVPPSQGTAAQEAAQHSAVSPVFLDPQFTEGKNVCSSCRRLDWQRIDSVTEEALENCWQAFAQGIDWCGKGTVKFELNGWEYVFQVSTCTARRLVEPTLQGKEGNAPGASGISPRSSSPGASDAGPTAELPVLPDAGGEVSEGDRTGEKTAGEKSMSMTQEGRHEKAQSAEPIEIVEDMTAEETVPSSSEEAEGKQSKEAGGRQQETTQGRATSSETVSPLNRRTEEENPQGQADLCKRDKSETHYPLSISPQLPPAAEGQRLGGSGDLSRLSSVRRLGAVLSAYMRRSSTVLSDADTTPAFLQADGVPRRDRLVYAPGIPPLRFVRVEVAGGIGKLSGVPSRRVPVNGETDQEEAPRSDESRKESDTQSSAGPGVYSVGKKVETSELSGSCCFVYDTAAVIGPQDILRARQYKLLRGFL